MPSVSNRLDVLIAGAGPTGLTMACELARHGVSLRIIDQAETPSDKSKALAVHSRTLEALEAMGIADELVAKGVKVHSLNMYANGRRIVHLLMDPLETRYPFVLSIPQSETERTLTGLLARFGLPVERPVTFLGFGEDGEGVTATVRHPDGQAEEIRARWLVGCDGAHSIVRKGLDLPFAGSRYEEAFMLADVRLEWKLSKAEAHVFLSPQGLLAAIPISGDRHRVIMDVLHEQTETDQTEADLEAFQAFMEGRGVIGASLRDPTWVAIFRIHRRLVPRLQVGRVFLAGDAAHIHSPVGGQGMNLGIQDSYNLAWKLALVSRGAGNPVLLDSYQAERYPIDAATVSGTDVATRVVTLRNPLAQAVRNQLTSFLSSLDVVQQRLIRAVSGLALNYRQSPIVAEHRAGLLDVLKNNFTSARGRRLSEWRGFRAALSAGDHAADGIVSARGSGGPVRLLELLRTTRHTLLLFAGGRATVAGHRALEQISARIRERYADFITVHLVSLREPGLDGLRWDGSVLLDPEGKLHDRYGAGIETLYLIRPDGYVGYRSQPAEVDRLFVYLQTIFS